MIVFAMGLAATALSACRGRISASAGPGAEPADGGPGPPPPSLADLPAGDPAAAPRMPLRRLNRTEYNNVIRDLFGNNTRPGDALPVPIAGSSGFATSGVVGEVDVTAYQLAAERLAAAVNLELFSGCNAVASGARPCAEKLVNTFGRRVFRRPLTAAEAADLLGLYDTLGATLSLDHDAAARAVLEAMLQDVPFLYHWELGPTAPEVTAGVVALTPYELASRLSFFLWSTMPDGALFDAADSGALADAATLEAQARRMLADPKAADTIRSFHLQWLEVSIKGAAKSADLYPDFTPALAQDMEDELVAFAQSIVRDPKAGLAGLFTDNRGFANAALAPIYGVAGTGTALAPVKLDAAQRPGILTRAAFLTMTSNAYEGDPTKRGSVVRRRVLCQPLVPPPANVPPLPPPAPNATVRERHEMHMTLPSCSPCHRMMDLIGFGFGNYDAVGRFGTSEAGKTVNVSGTIASLDGKDRAFAGPAELMQLLAASPQVQTCLTRQWLRFALDRLETPADDYSLHQIFERFRGSGFDMGELLVSIATSRSFRFRAPSEGEVTQ